MLFKLFSFAQMTVKKQNNKTNRNKQTGKQLKKMQPNLFFSKTNFQAKKNHQRNWDCFINAKPRYYCQVHIIVKIFSQLKNRICIELKWFSNAAFHIPETMNTMYRHIEICNTNPKPNKKPQQTNLNITGKFNTDSCTNLMCPQVCVKPI